MDATSLGEQVFQHFYNTLRQRGVTPQQWTDLHPFQRDAWIVAISKVAPSVQQQAETLLSVGQALIAAKKELARTQQHYEELRVRVLEAEAKTRELEARLKGVVGPKRTTKTVQSGSYHAVHFPHLHQLGPRDILRQAVPYDQQVSLCYSADEQRFHVEQQFSILDDAAQWAPTIGRRQAS